MMIKKSNNDFPKNDPTKMMIATIKGNLFQRFSDGK